MNRNRSSTEPGSQQPFIASISSNIPVMATGNDSDAQYSKQLSINSTTDAESILNAFQRTPTRDSKRGRTICQPKGTKPYIVGNSDTLEKISLHFNSTPSELLQLNKLNTRIVFPGQMLYVPEISPSSITDEQQPHPLPTSPISSVPLPSSTTKAKDTNAFILLDDRRLSGESSPPSTQQDVGPMVWSMTRQSTAKPGRAQRLKSGASAEENEGSSSRLLEDRVKTLKEDNTKQVQQIQKSLSVDESQKLDAECLQRFIKVNVRLMTEDHKSVAGTLLVTPNAVMFDPDVLDPLVKEHGIDKYGLIIRMDFLGGIALYEDIAMYEHEATLRDEEKRKMYHSTSIKDFHQCAHVLSNNDEEHIHDLMSTLLDRIDRENTSSDHSYQMLFDASSSSQHRRSVDHHQLSDSEDVFHSLDDHKHSVGILVEDEDIPSQGYHLENCIPVDEFNKRLGEIDKLVQKQHDIYVTPHPIEIPYYLCIKTSTLMNEMASVIERQNKKSIDNVYGKKDLDHEYWFSVPKEKKLPGLKLFELLPLPQCQTVLLDIYSAIQERPLIDHLYTFFLRWSPERASDPFFDDDYPDSGNTSINRPSPHTPSKSYESMSGKGFVLLANDDPELTDDYLSANNTSSRSRTTTTSSSDSSLPSKKQHYLKRQNTLLKEWEIINVEEIYRRINATQANNSHNSDIGIPPPKLLQPSTLLDEDQSKLILVELPARVHGLNWKLVFSTDAHGFSLNQLYRRSMDVDQDSPALLIVKDVEQNIFGAYISQQLMISEGFYGTGESFLFTFYPQFRVFHWSGHNQFFVKGDVKTLGIGSGEGTYGLWLDAELYHGRTCPSKTFNNAQLSSKEDFIIASLEVWTFID